MHLFLDDVDDARHFGIKQMRCPFPFCLLEDFPYRSLFLGGEYLILKKKFIKEKNLLERDV